MRVFKVDLGYIWESDEGKKQDRIGNRLIRLAAAGVPVPTDCDPQHLSGLVINGDQLLSLLTAGEEVKIGQEVSIVDSLETALARFNTIAERLLLIPTPERAYNEKCEVHMPGQALATYNETLLLSDSCSDALQSALDEGWRVISACPQPDQRRPDYILGRFNPERTARESGHGAKRDA